MIEDQLRKDMLNIYKQADIQCHYKATRFLQMINEKGALITAKQLIAKDGGTSGFTKLWEYGRLDLSLEVLVLNEKYETLFTVDEKEQCRQRLTAYGYKVEEH